MAQTIIDDEDIIKVVMKPVGTNGQISIGTEFAGRHIIAYITEDKRKYIVEDKNKR